MTTLHISKTASQLKLAAIACQLAPALYQAETAFYGIKGEPFDALSAAQQRVFIDRAEIVVLGSIGYLDSKARERAHRLAVLTHEIYDEFNEDACRVIEQAMSDAVANYGHQLLAVWREQKR